MLTPEQIENLKPGDNLLLEAFFVEKDGDNIKFTLEPPYSPGLKVFRASPYSLRFLCGADRTFCHVGDNLVKPKHDPCRPYKKGDIVKPAERHGRKTPKLNYKAEYTVTSSEDDYGTVGVEYFNGAMTVSVSIPFYWLELVTPAEEMEPYSVLESDAFDIVRNGKIVMTIPFTADDYYTFEQAKAAAEAERDRLNAEYGKRKEQK